MLLERALPILHLTAEPGLLEQIATYSNGDARTAYNVLELAAAASQEGVLVAQAVEDAMQRKMLLYDKIGRRALQPDFRAAQIGALGPGRRAVLAGENAGSREDRLYIARRLVRMAIEDIGLADPRAVEQAIACQQAVHFLGVPEGDQALAQIAIYLAVAPKSDAAYQALDASPRVVRNSTVEPVPMHLRNAPTRAMKEWG